jgi:hypothetical protein
MAKKSSVLTIRKSIFILIGKIIAVQVVIVLLYLLIRLSKYWFLRQVFTDNNYHDLNFWLGIIVFTVLLLLQTVVLMAIVLEWFYEYYEVRSDLIVHTKGVLRKKEDIYSLKTVEAGSVTQSFIAKICNFGTIEVYSPVLQSKYYLNDVPDPHNIKDAVVALLSSEKDKDKKIIPKERI